MKAKEEYKKDTKEICEYLTTKVGKEVVSADKFSLLNVKFHNDERKEIQLVLYTNEEGAKAYTMSLGFLMAKLDEMAATALKADEQAMQQFAQALDAKRAKDNLDSMVR